MSQKFKSDIETQAGLIDSFGFTGTAGQILSSTGTKTEWITPPQSPGGGGSSQVFYFNGGTASSVGGYYQMSPVANTGTGADFTINANGYIASFLTDVNSPNQLNIPAGNWNFEIYFSASSGGGSPSFYVELYKYSSSTFTLIASSSATPEGITNGTAIDLYITALAVPTTTLLATDRLAVRVYVTHSGRTIKMHTQNGYLSEVITTFSTGLTALNGLTEQVQYFSTGTAGTDFNISSATDTHTFNLPTASALNRGALSSADWTTFNSKANASGTTNYVSKFTGATTLGNSQIFDNGTNIGIGTTSPSQKLTVGDGTGTGNQYIRVNSSASDIYIGQSGGTIFGLSANSAQLILADAVSYPLGIGTISAQPFILGTQNAERMRITSGGNVGIGTTSPSEKMQVLGNIRLTNNNLTTPNTLSSEINNYNGSANQFKSSSIKFLTGSFVDQGQITFNTSISGVDQERLRIAENGNVGIGTTSPGVKFVNAGAPLADNPTLGSGTIGSQALISANGLYGMYSGVSSSGDVWHQVQRNDGNTTAYNLLLQPSGGNVGIGTINTSSYPFGEKLNVAGNITINGTKIGFGTTDSFVAYGWYSAAHYGISWAGNNPLALSGYYGLGFFTLGSEKMRIDTSGNVGIGTSSPSGKLTISGVDNGCTIDMFNTGISQKYRLVVNTVSGALAFENNSGTETIRFNQNGNVGIGTTSPTSPLHIVKSGGAKINLGDSQNTVAISSIEEVGDSAIGFYTQTTTERMRITSGGNVGIGTTSPGANLTVVRNANNASYITTFSNTNAGASAATISEWKVNGYSSFVIGKSNSDGRVEIAQIGNNNIDFINNGINVMSIDTNQNVMVNGTTAEACAQLEVESTTKGFLPPRMNDTQRDNISHPVEGLMIYNTTQQTINFYDGTTWQRVAVV